MSGLGENSCSINSMGKIAARSCGASGWRVWGFSGGLSGSESDGSTFTQAVGIWLSARRNLECWDMRKAYGNTKNVPFSAPATVRDGPGGRLSFARDQARR